MALLLESGLTEVLLGVALVLVVLIYRSLTSQFDHWRRLGVPYLPPQPFFGNVRDLVLQQTSYVGGMTRLYKEGAPHPFIGIFYQTGPVLLVRDPELIRSILIKDFTHFSSRFASDRVPKDTFTENLFFLDSRRWRPLRAKLSPTFSSGRIKSMFPLLVECASKLQDSMSGALASGPQVIEVRDALCTFTTDVIGSSVFGLQFNAIQDPESPFRTIPRKIFQPGQFVFAIAVLFEAFPILRKLPLPISLFTNKTSRYFVQLVKDTINERQQKGITRNDFLQLLIQLKEKGHLDGEKSLDETEESIEFTDELMAAQCIVFFLAGFETSSNTISFCLHELAIHQDIQDKLRREIDTVLNKHGGQLTYDGIQEMTYLDQVVSGSRVLQKFEMAFLLESGLTEALLGVVLVLVIVIYRSLTSPFDHWRRLGVPFLPPQPFFGNVRDIVLQQKSIAEGMNRLYKEGAPHPFIGIFYQSCPALLVRDPEIIRSILIKDFTHFASRFAPDRMIKDTFTENLFFLESRRWRPLRTKLSPTFSSGRIKSMFPLLVECATKLQDSMSQTVASGPQVVEMRDTLGQFSIDVIGSCVFGLQFNAIQDPESPFRTIPRKMFQPKKWAFAIAVLFEAFPILKKLPLSISLLTSNASRYFINLVKDTVNDRQQKGITRNDFLQLLIQLKEKGHLDGDNAFIETEESIEFTEELMTAQCLVFFLAGFETSSNTMSFCLHELAVHQDIQDKLRREINDVLDKHGGQLKYEAIQEMTYLDQVVSETLRMYPSLSLLERHCEIPYKIPGTDTVLEPNTRIMIPVSGLQWDPQYFPDPDRFDPERFSVTNKDNINKGAYLPFGDGPRNCIGMRFGLLQTKVGLVAFLSRFRVEVSSETKVPPQLVRVGLISVPDDGVRLKVMNVGSIK